MKLRELENVNWAPKIGERYRTLSQDIYNPTIDAGDGTSIFKISKGLQADVSLFITVIANALYGDNVTIKEDNSQ